MKSNISVTSKFTVGVERYRRERARQKDRVAGGRTLSLAVSVAHT